MYLVIVIIGILAGAISGIVGTGASIMLLPALAYTFGPKAAIPIMAIAAVMGNISRVYLWRREINFRAFFLYATPAVPAAVLGANSLWMMPVGMSNLCIGLFFVLLIPLRYLARERAFTLNAWQLGLAGLVVGYLTGVVFSTGPLTVPLFAGYGLVKGALLSTEAAASFAVYFAKAATFGAIGAIPASILISGLLVGTTLVVGMFIGKQFVLKMSEKTFNCLIDTMLLMASASLLWDAFSS